MFIYINRFEEIKLYVSSYKMYYTSDTIINRQNTVLKRLSKTKCLIILLTLQPKLHFINQLYRMSNDGNVYVIME